MTSANIYAKLKDLPEPEFGTQAWPEDYQALGFGKEEVEGLLKLASDFYLKNEQSDEESSVSIHAWRALAASGDASLLPKFLALSIGCEEIGDEWFESDFARILGEMGMAAWPELVAAVRNTPEYPCLAHGLFEGAHLMVRNDDDRAQVIATVVNLLDHEPFNRFDRALAIGTLVDLKAVEEIEVIRKNYAANRVDLTMLGDIEDVEIELELREKRETPGKKLHEEEARLADLEKKELAGPFPTEGSLEEKLQYFLMRYGRREDSIRRVDQLNGFLLALSLSGVRMSNLERADCVWDPLEGNAASRPQFESKEEGQRWLACVRDYYRDIEAGMADGSYQAHVSTWPDAQESMDPEAPYFTPWLEGLVLGDILFNLAGEGEDLNYHSFLLTIKRALAEEEEGIRLLEDRDDNPIFDLMEAIHVRYANRVPRNFSPDALLDEGYLEGTAVAQAISQKDEVPRNAPCPCGSGRKYKKCCMN